MQRQPALPQRVCRGAAEPGRMKPRLAISAVIRAAARRWAAVTAGMRALLGGPARDGDLEVRVLSGMTLGMTPRQGDMFRSTAGFCEGLVAPDSIYALLHRACFALLPDEMFADLFTGTGRRSVPPMIVAAVTGLRRLEGLSDRGAADRFTYDVRWKEERQSVQ